MPTVQGLWSPLSIWIEYEVYGDLIIIYPKPQAIYFRGTIVFRVEGLRSPSGVEADCCKSRMSQNS